MQGKESRWVWDNEPEIAKLIGLDMIFCEELKFTLHNHEDTKGVPEKLDRELARLPPYVWKLFELSKHFCNKLA